MRALFIFLLSITFTGGVFAQSFTNASASLPAAFNSGGCVGVTDMNNDGLDDIIVLHNSRFLRVFYQTPNGFDLEVYGTISSNNQWGMAIGDMNRDGHRDVISGGAYDGVRLVQITSQGQSTTTTLPNGSMFMQACNVVDIDNDGHLDYFACHDDALSRMWRNDGSGNLVPANDLIDLTDYDTGNFPNTDHSGNYGSVWSDINDDGNLDLIIAKCRQGVSNAQDPRRINQAWINDGNGNWTEEAVDRGIAIFQQSWTVDFADINNNGHMDCLITNHTSTMKLLLNDGNGFFTDITASAGLAVSGFFLQAKMADFDNDGFVDIIYAGGVHRYYRNNGDNTFTHVPNTFPYSDTMHSFGIGDLNNDGALDVYASYGNGYVNPDANNPDILWLNQGNDNNWVVFDLQGVQSNIDAVGAKVKIYGDWGVQIREVRAGESYGIVNTFHAHFGLGQSSQITEAVIEWPSGLVTVLENPDINTTHQVLEATCFVEDVVVTAAGQPVICEGESVVLSAPDGFTYQWSTGEQSQSIEVTAQGAYSVVVTSDAGCLGVSEAILVEVIQPEQPVITLLGDPIICQGSTVTLEVTEGLSYLWSESSSTQSIEVTASGVYSVEVSGICGAPIAAEPIEIIVLDNPEPSVDAFIEVAPNTDVVVSAGGETIRWFANLDDLEPLATGNDLLVNIDESTTLYVENQTVYGGEEAQGGKSNLTEEGGQYHTNSSFWLVFDAHTDLVLESVKVFAGTTANRTIALIDANGTTLQSLSVNIPEGEQTVELNFEVPQGQGYGLRSVGNNPQLWRDGPPTGFEYPYALGDLATITSTSITGSNALNFYYFFYDWKVSTPTFTCVSDRLPVTLMPATSPECLGDFDNDGVITTSDLLILLANFGCVNNCNGDLNGDALVNTADMLIFLTVFGSACDE